VVAVEAVEPIQVDVMYAVESAVFMKRVLKLINFKVAAWLSEIRDNDNWDAQAQHHD